MAEKDNTFKIPVGLNRLLKPMKRQSISEWVVDKPFEIAEKGAVRPGPYDLAWTPWWREPLDACGDPTVRKMNVVASSQTGKTEFTMAVIAFWAENKPTNMLYVRPSEPDVVEAFRDRFKPMLERNTPELIPQKGEWVRVGDNPVISLTSMLIYGAAATIPRQLTSRTTMKVLFDETDTGGDTGNMLGNVLDQLDERQMAGSMLQAFTLGTSTPKYEDGSNWQAYEQLSDRREYWEPCPHCGKYQPLRFENLRVVDGAERDPLVIQAEDMARFACVGCGAMIEPEWQHWMSDRGVWVPNCQQIKERLPLEDEEIRESRSLTVLPDAERWVPKFEGEKPRNPHRGYRVWRANTKFEQCGWSHLLARWFQVQKTKDPEKLQVYINNTLAEPFTQAIEAVDDDTLKERIGVYEPRVVPARAKVILGAIDIQADCLWFTFRAFGPKQESWLIQYGTIEVILDDFDAALDSIYEMAMYEGWKIKGSEMHMRAYAIGVDSGYRTGEAYEFSRRPGVIALKGEDIPKYRVRMSEVEGKKTPEPIRLYLMNMRVFKDRLQRLIKVKTGEQGEWHLHAETTDDYITHLTSEHLAPRKSTLKIKTWQLRIGGRPNHMLDTEAYTLGLAEALEQMRELSIMTLAETDPQMGVFRSRGKRIVEPRKPKRRQQKKQSKIKGKVGDW